MHAYSFLAVALAAGAALLATAPVKANGGAQWSVTVESPRYYYPPSSAAPSTHPYYHRGPTPPGINPPGPFLQPSPDSYLYPQPVPDHNQSWREREWQQREWEDQRAQRWREQRDRRDWQQREWDERRDRDRRSWADRERDEQDRRWREWRQNNHPDRDWHAPNPRFGGQPHSGSGGGHHDGRNWGQGDWRR